LPTRSACKRHTCKPPAFAPTRGFGTLPTLRSSADVVRFLTTQARYPLFGKLVRGSGSFGSVLTRKLEGMIATLGNGQTISVSKLADEVATHQTCGYIFQNALTPHPPITTLTGSNSLSTMRVITVNHGDTPEILYTLWKLPAPTAMSDNFRQKCSLISLVEPTSGLVQKIRYSASHRRAPARCDPAVLAIGPRPPWLRHRRHRQWRRADRMQRKYRPRVLSTRLRSRRAQRRLSADLRQDHRPHRRHPERLRIETQSLPKSQCPFPTV